MQKLFIWLGMFIGASAGGMAPQLWGAGLFSGWGLLLSVLGGITGLWAGYKVGRALF